jgi:hypothetical protein
MILFTEQRLAGVGCLIAGLLLSAGCSGPRATPAVNAQVTATPPVTAPVPAAPQTPLETWAAMKACVKAGDFDGAASFFVARRRDNYRQMLKGMGKAQATEMLDGLSGFTPWMEAATIAGYSAEAKTPQGSITFTVNFEKENGAWKVLEF